MSPVIGSSGGSIDAEGYDIQRWRYRGDSTGYATSGKDSNEIKIRGEVRLAQFGIAGGNAKGLVSGRFELTDSIGQEKDVKLPPVTRNTEAGGDIKVDIQGVTVPVRVTRGQCR